MLHASFLRDFLRVLIEVWVHNNTFEFKENVCTPSSLSTWNAPPSLILVGFLWCHWQQPIVINCDYCCAIIIFFAPGLVPEQKDEGQTAEALLTVASPPCRPPGSTPDGPRFACLRLAVPFPPAAPPPSSPAPPLPSGPLLTDVFAS